MNDARADLQSFGRSLLGRRPVRWRAAVLCAASTFLLTACQGSRTEQFVEVRQSSERNASSEKMDSPAPSTVVHRHSAGRVTLRPSSTTTVEHVFKLVNDRAEAVEIRDIETNCVCIDVAVGRMHLAPGEATDVRITMEVVASGSSRFGAALTLNTGDVEVFELHAVGVVTSELRVARETHLIRSDGTHDVRLMLIESDPDRTDIAQARPEFIADGLDSAEVAAWYLVEDGRSEASFRPWRGLSRATLRFRPDAPYPVTVTVRLAPLADQTFVVDARQ